MPKVKKRVTESYKVTLSRKEMEYLRDMTQNKERAERGDMMKMRIKLFNAFSGALGQTGNYIDQER